MPNPSVTRSKSDGTPIKAKVLRDSRLRAAGGVVVGFAVLSTGVLAGWGQGPAGSKSAANAGSSDLATLEVLNFEITTVATGALEAKKQVELRNQLDAESTLVEIVPEGTRVKKGDTLAKLNSDQVKQQIAAQEIELERAKNDLATAEADLAIQRTDTEAEIRKATVTLQLAELEFEQWLQGDVETKRQELRVRLDEAHSEVDRLTLKVAQNVSLKAKGFISQDDLQKQELELRKQTAALETAALAQRVYESLQMPKERKQKQEVIDAAKAELTKTQQRTSSQLAGKESRASNSRREVSLREQRLAKLNEQLALATLIAPQDGLVVYGTTVENRWWSNEGPMQIGRKIYPNQLVIALPDTGPMNAVVQVHESIAGKIKPGQSASVRIEAIGGKTVRGKVEKVGLLAQTDNYRDPNLREYKVTVNLDQGSESLEIRPSMSCEASILLDTVDSVLAAPVQAIFADGRAHYVLVPVEGGRFERVPVSVGRMSDRFAELPAGVKAGQRVLVRAPKPGEVLPGEFTDAQLTAVGLHRSTKGEIEPLPDPAQPGQVEPTATAPASAEAAPAPSPKNG